ncbi:putative e3 ubiquitin-protein ligase lin-1 [Quercus suber]|uniref:E3 ubiquitin-protein ligase lin-1 n=1 Tax=Quercus suber TaxID=58331 RepID=A0AAW0K7R4_QUESU
MWQEVDLCNYTTNTFYSGTRKLLGKQVIHSLHVHKDLLFAGGSLVDAIAGKVFLLSTKAVIGSFPTGFDIQNIAINSDFIYTATKCGFIELEKVASIKMAGGGHAKITSLTSDINELMLFAASSDGRIQASARNHKLTK